MLTPGRHPLPPLAKSDRDTVRDNSIGNSGTRPLEDVSHVFSKLFERDSRAKDMETDLHRLSEGILPLRILVVDDDASLRKACCEIAYGMGFVALAAGSVQEALTVLRRQPVEMLLLDLKLPGGGGLKLLGEVKTLYPRIAVVIMTAFATVASAVEVMRIGAGDYLTKPFVREESDQCAGPVEP